MASRFGLSVGTMAVIVTVVIANLGNNIIAPVMPALRDYFDSSVAQVGLVASGFGVGRLVMDLPAGYLTDRISPKRMFAIGILVSGGAAALAAYSTTLEQLIIFRTIMGFGSAIMTTVALVLLVSIALPRQRGQVLAMYTSAMLFGQAISPTIGGYLATHFTWRAAFVFCALTPLVSFPLNLLATSGTASARRAVAPHGRPSIPSKASHRGGSTIAVDPPNTNWPALATVYCLTFTNFFNRHGMRAALLPLYAGMMLGLDPATIGTILTTGSVFTILVTLPGGALGDRIGRKQLLVPGLVTLAAGNLFLLSGDSQLIFVIATVFVSMGVLANTMSSGLVADLIPEPLVGKGMGMYRFTGDLGVVLGPFVLGLVVDRYGFASALVLGAIVVLLGVPAALALIPRKTAPASVRPGA